jgi:hypothetical protein
MRGVHLWAPQNRSEDQRRDQQLLHQITASISDFDLGDRHCFPSRLPFDVSMTIHFGHLVNAPDSSLERTPPGPIRQETN